MKTTTIALLALLMTACLCEEQTKQRAISPDGKWTATYVERDCGATAAYVARVEIDRKVVLIVETPSLSLAWRSNTELVVRTRDPMRVFEQNSHPHVRVLLNPR